MLDSTTWFDKDGRDIFITALLMATPKQFDDPMAQIEVNSLKDTGWIIPAGWYGFVDAASLGIINRCGLPTDLGLDALVRLGSPELESRSQSYEGRRLVRIDGGFLILNYIEYREKDHTAAERQRRYRAKQKLKPIRSILDRDGERCGICGKAVKASDAHIDHIVPLVQGGIDHSSNKQFAHATCNNGKSGTNSAKSWRHADMPIVNYDNLRINSNAVTYRNITQVEAEAEVEAKEKTYRATKRVPAKWVLSDVLAEYAVNQGMTDEIALEELESFRDHEYKNAKKDWDAAWRTWCRNWKKWKKDEKNYRKPDDFATIHARVKARAGLD